MTIGVFDSGIGGLTTLQPLIEKYQGHDYFYLSDNANMPYGTKSGYDIFKAVKAGLKLLEYESDVQIVACNTASTVVAPGSAFLLKPSIDGLRPENTLVLATPATLSRLKANERMFNTADTRELASLVEICASLGYKRYIELDFSILTRYVINLTSGFDTINNVVLGCSHYLYLKRIIQNRFPTAKIIDGNENLLNELDGKIKNKAGKGTVKFAFTGANEEKKYRWILENLQNRKI